MPLSGCICLWYNPIREHEMFFSWVLEHTHAGLPTLLCLFLNQAVSSCSILVVLSPVSVSTPGQESQVFLCPFFNTLGSLFLSPSLIFGGGGVCCSYPPQRTYPIPFNDLLENQSGQLVFIKPWRSLGHVLCMGQISPLCKWGGFLSAPEWGFSQLWRGCGRYWPKTMLHS